MNVLLLKDVESVGMAGQVVRVKEGYARNFLFPKQLAKVASSSDVVQMKKAVKKAAVDKELLGSRVAMLAEHVRNTHLTIKKKIHDDDKLYGAVSADEIVDLLKEKGIQVNRKQIEFPKAIRTTGEHKVVVRLSSKLKPEATVKVVGGEE